MAVHNHGPGEGPGLECRERLTGTCQQQALEKRLDLLSIVLAEALESVEELRRDVREGAYVSGASKPGGVGERKPLPSPPLRGWIMSSTDS